MTSSPNHEPSPDAIIRDLHRIREAIVKSYGGDLHALTADARQRQKQSSRPVWSGQKSTAAKTGAASKVQRS
ncbi:MAG: hypothetical protein WBC44_22340 [Planctomycetaceae bacterium]